MDKTSELIDKMTAKLRPVRQIRLSRFFVIWVAVALMIGGYFLNSVGMRPDLSSKLGHADFVLGLLLYLSVA